MRRTKLESHRNEPLRRVTYTVDEVSVLLGLSRSAVYEGIARGEIPAKRFGRRIVVVRSVLEAMLMEPDPPSIGRLDRLEDDRPDLETGAERLVRRG
jgi:excisionase family DNA binding protein